MPRCSHVIHKTHACLDGNMGGFQDIIEIVIGPKGLVYVSMVSKILCARGKEIM